MSRQRVSVPIGVAAKALGLSVDAVRKRIRRGTLEAYKEGDRWLVVLDDVLPGVQDVSSYPAGSPVQDGTPIEAAFSPVGESPTVALVPLDTMLRELGGLVDQISALSARNEALAQEVGMLRERTAARVGELAAQAETIATQRDHIAHQAETLAAERATVAELRRRAEAAEAERDALRRQVAAPVEPAPVIVAVDATPQPFTPAPRPWWRRWFGGE